MFVKDHIGTRASGSRPPVVRRYSSDGTLTGELALRREFKVGERQFNKFSIRLYGLVETTRGGVFVVSAQDSWYPAFVYMVDPSTMKVIQEYGHPGHVRFVHPTPVQVDGTEQFLIGGCNNPEEGIGHAFAALLPLEPTHSSPGKYPMWTPDPQPLRYFVFPRPDSVEVEHTVPCASQVIPLKDGWEIRTDELVAFTLDRNFELVSARMTDLGIRRHNEAYSKRLLDHLWEPGELSDLCKLIELDHTPDGNAEWIEEEFHRMPSACSEVEEDP